MTTSPYPLLARVSSVLRAHWALVVIVAVGFALRLGWVLIVDSDQPAGEMALGDQYSYYYYGRELAAGRGYVSYQTGEPTAYYPIGYPATLAVVFWIVQHTPLSDDLLLAGQLLNVVAGTASVVFAYIIGRAVFGTLAGLVGAGLLAVFPNLIFNTASLQLETVFIFWCLAALCVVVVHNWTSAPSTRRLIVFGVLLGVSVLVRPFSVWFLVGVFVAALMGRLGWRRAIISTAIPLAVVVLVSVPWVVRNAISLGAFVPSSTNTGDALCLDRSEDATGGFRFVFHEGCADPLLPDVERNAENTRRAIQFVIEHPVREMVQIARRARLMFAVDRDGIEASNLVGHGPVVSEEMGRRLGDVADGYFHLVTVLAVAGFVIALRRRWRSPASALVLVAAVSLLAVPLLLWGNPRFHLPLSPLLAVLAGGAIAVGIDQLRLVMVGEPDNDRRDQEPVTETVEPVEAGRN